LLRAIYVAKHNLYVRGIHNTPSGKFRQNWAMHGLIIDDSANH